MEKTLTQSLALSIYVYRRRRKASRWARKRRPVKERVTIAHALLPQRKRTKRGALRERSRYKKKGKRNKRVVLRESKRNEGIFWRQGRKIKKVVLGERKRDKKSVLTKIKGEVWVNRRAKQERALKAWRIHWKNYREICKKIFKRRVEKEVSSNTALNEA